MIREAITILLKESPIHQRALFFLLLLATSVSDLVFLIGADFLIRDQSPLLEGEGNKAIVIAAVLFAIPFRYASLWTLLKMAFNRAPFSSVYLFRNLVSSQGNSKLIHTESQRLRDSLDNGLTTLIFHYLVPFIHLSTSLLSIVFVLIWLFLSIDFCCLDFAFLASLLLVVFIYIAKRYVSKKSSNANMESRKLQMAKDNITENIDQIFRRGLWDLLLERLTERSTAFWQTKYAIYFSSISPRLLIEFAMATVLVLFVVEGVSSQNDFSNFAVLVFAAQRLLPFTTQSWSNYNLMQGSYPIVKEHWRCFLDNRKNILKSPKEKSISVSSIKLSSVHFPGWKEKISLRVQNNDRVLISGKSGIGKSRLLKSIAGLDKPESGVITIYDQKNSKHLKPHASLLNIYYLSQSTHIIEGDVYINVSLSNSFDRANIDSLLERFGLKYLINADHSRLLLTSGGEQQRLSLCRAVYSKADVLLLDEFTSALDFKSQAFIVDFINEMQNVILIVVSHRKLDAVHFTHKVEVC